MSLKARSWAATVHTGHSDFAEWLLKIGGFHEEGLVDYAAISYETSKMGKFHLNAFVIFNESALVPYEAGPSDLLEGSWSKAKSLTGAHDYCMATGIHYRKKGVHSLFEIGQWVDAGFNINIKFRKQYQFAEMLKDGFSPSDIAKLEPAAAMIVGLKNLQELQTALIGLPPVLTHEPYYYIGLENWSDIVANFQKIFDENACDEEE